MTMLILMMINLIIFKIIFYANQHKALGFIYIIIITIAFRSTLKVKVNRWIYIVLYYKPFISKVLRYGLCYNKEIIQFYLPPT